MSGNYKFRLLEVARAARALVSLGVQDMKYGNKRFDERLVALCAAVEHLDRRDSDDDKKEDGERL